LLEDHIHILQGKPILNILRNGIRIRNEIVHGQANTIDEPVLREILVIVRDLLYIFDVCAGHQWAYSHISFETASSLANSRGFNGSAP
jgi:hypothetical protein